MAKKQKHKKEDKAKKTQSKEESEEFIEDENEDFGGLPERDLKKNLGCG